MLLCDTCKWILVTCTPAGRRRVPPPVPLAVSGATTTMLLYSLVILSALICSTAFWRPALIAQLRTGPCSPRARAFLESALALSLGAWGKALPAAGGLALSLNECSSNFDNAALLELPVPSFEGCLGPCTARHPCALGGGSAKILLAPPPQSAQLVAGERPAPLNFAVANSPAVSPQRDVRTSASCLTLDASTPDVSRNSSVLVTWMPFLLHFVLGRRVVVFLSLLVAVQAQVVTTLAGYSPGNNNGVGTSARFNSPSGLAFSSTGQVLYVADTANHLIRAVTPSGTVTALAGYSSGNNNGVGTSARFFLRPGTVEAGIPELFGGTAVFNSTLLIADTLNSLLRRICPPLYLSGATFSCTPCAAGTININPSVNGPCGACASGTYSTSANSAISASCVTCPLGTWAPASSSACALCGAGTYQATAGAACQSCPAGTIPNAARTACDTCSTGTWALSSSSSCSPCPLGTYGPTAGAASVAQCLPCPAGTWGGSLSLFSLSQCAQCTPGHYCPANTSTPINCPANTFNNAFGSAALSFCQACANGTFSAPGSTVCQVSIVVRCSPGLYNSNASDPSKCAPCAAGTYSDTTGAAACSACPQGMYSGGGATVCLACPRGAYCSAGLPVECPAGTFGQTLGASTLAMCQPCSAGSYNPAAGSSSMASCVSCPAGAYSDAPGASSCMRCPPGTFSAASGSMSLAECQLCDIGSFSILPGQSACTGVCPKGTYGTGIGGTSAASSCANCTAGRYAPFAGSSACEDCLPGFFSAVPGSSICSACPAGTSSVLSASSSAATCEPCPAGTFSPAAGLTSCISCPSGRASAAIGAASLLACLPCSPGTYASQASSSACQTCDLGTFSSQSGVSCTPCPLGYVGTRSGGANASDACKLCPPGKTTAASGAQATSQCLTFTFSCPPGTQPASSDKTFSPRVPTDCVPITCPRPLVLSLDGSGCIGCAPATYGVPPTCARCPSNFTCPGFLTLPLVSSPEVLAALPPTSTCLAVSVIRRPATVIPNQPASFTLASIPPLVTLCTAGGLSALIFALLAWAVRSPSMAKARLESFFKRIDSFAMSHLVPSGSPLINLPTALGGACSLLAFLTFCTLAIVLVLQNTYANVSVQTSLNTLLTSNPFSPAVKWAPPRSTLLAPSLVSGVQVRLLAQEGLGCNTLALGTNFSSSPSTWELTQEAMCGDGRTLLTLSCPACVFTTASVLQFTLPYTCQSFYLEAIAVDAMGSVNSVVFPTTSSVATPNALLSSLSWTVQVLGTFLQDTITGSSTQGAQLFVSSAVASTTPLSASIVPSMAAVTITIALPLQSTYSSTLLEPRQTLVELFSSIVGLLGILGLFRFLFMYAEAALTQKPRRKSTASPDGSGGEAVLGARAANALQHGGAAFTATNPLLRRGAGAAASAGEAAPASSLWHVRQDATDTWYVAVDGGSSTWVLPEGGVIVPE